MSTPGTLDNQEYLSILRYQMMCRWFQGQERNIVFLRSIKTEGSICAAFGVSRALKHWVAVLTKSRRFPWKRQRLPRTSSFQVNLLRDGTLQVEAYSDDLVWLCFDTEQLQRMSSTGMAKCSFTFSLSRLNSIKWIIWYLHHKVTKCMISFGIVEIDWLIDWKMLW